MGTLWLKFSDDGTLPDFLTPEEEKALHEIYDAANPQSVWTQALKTLGLKSGEKMLCVHAGAPYVNWSAIVQLLACGCVDIVKAKDGAGFSYESCMTLSRLPRLLRVQWRIARYVEQKIASGAAFSSEDTLQLVESTALGLAVQALLLRLPAHTPHMLAQWLEAPSSAPARVRRTIGQIEAVQRRRTLLSPAWRKIFPFRAQLGQVRVPPPASFWDTPPLESMTPHENANDAVYVTRWEGLPVCAGRVTGRAVVVTDIHDVPPYDAGACPIFVFLRARPETVEIFPQASAVLFAEGGALSHACTVAREQGIPCVTGLGRDFLQSLAVHGGHDKKAVWLTVDGASGRVELIDGLDKGAAHP